MSKKKLMKQVKKEAKSLASSASVEAKSLAKTAKKEARTKLKTTPKKKSGKKKVVLTASLMLGAYAVAKHLGLFDDEDEYSSQPQTPHKRM